MDIWICFLVKRIPTNQSLNNPKTNKESKIFKPKIRNPKTSKAQTKRPKTRRTKTSSWKSFLNVEMIYIYSQIL